MHKKKRRNEKKKAKKAHVSPSYFYPCKTTVTCPECATSVCDKFFPLMAPMRGERYESPS